MGKRGPQARDLSERFWEKVAILGEKECWLWQAYRCKFGYGKFGLTDGTIMYSHRMAYELTYGEIPKGQFVLHRCDVGPCCNPNHLFLGTQTDNMADMNAKGRCFKLPVKKQGTRGWKDADAIHTLFATGRYSKKALGLMFGVSGTLITAILKAPMFVQAVTAEANRK